MAHVLLGPDHVLWHDPLVVLFLVELPRFNGAFLERDALLVSVLGDFRSRVVPDVRVEGCHEHERGINEFRDSRLVWDYAVDAALGEASGSVADNLKRVKERAAHDRLEDVELKVPLKAAYRDCGVVSNDLGANHGQSLALGRVHLSGHDAAAGLVLRQGNFSQSAPRAAPEKPDIIGYFVERNGGGVESPRHFNEAVMGSEGFELVGSSDEGQLSFLRREAKRNEKRGRWGGCWLGEWRHQQPCGLTKRRDGKLDDCCGSPRQ